LACLLQAWPQGVGALPHRADLLLRALRESAVGPWRELLRDLTSREVAEQLLARARQESRECSAGAAAERRDGWHRFVSSDLARGGRRVFRWVRHGPQSAFPPAVPVSPEAGGWGGGPGAELAFAEPAWQTLWTRPDLPAPDEASWLAELDALPPFPPLPPITAESLAEVFASLPTGKAGGGDGWVGEEFRRWPPELLAPTARLLQAVEASGSWPQLLASAEVVLLPKPGGDSGDPLSRRPITLLPVLYRAWARLRRRSVDDWRPQWDPAIAAAGLGADGQAWELGWAAAVAHASALLEGGVVRGRGVGGMGEGPWGRCCSGWNGRRSVRFHQVL